jgi:hypothetical protein
MTTMLDKLARLIGTGLPVEIYRGKLEMASTMGFVVGVSPDTLLLHIIESNSLTLNGYIAYRISDITSFQVNATFIGKALRLAGHLPAIPEGIDATSLHTVIQSAASQYPLVTIAREEKCPGTIYIGKPTQCNTKALWLQKIGTRADWRGIERFKWKNITLVSFGDGYSRGIAALLNSQERQGGS